MNRTRRPRAWLDVRLIVALLASMVLTSMAPPARAQVDGSESGLQPGDPPVANEPGQSLLIMNDGRRFQGRIKSKDRFELVLEIAGIDTRFKVADILEIVALKTFDEHYAELKNAIAREDWERRYQFCQWIHKRRRLELAARELEELLDDNPRLEDARELLRIVNAEIELQARQEEAEAERQTGPEESAAAPQAEGPRLTPTMLLTDEDVNLMRVYETDLKNPPRLLVRRSTIERLLSEHATSELLPTTPEGRKAYFRRDPVDILADIFTLQARDLYGEVQVLSEPLSLNKFRLNVHRVWLMNSCATNQCHGGVGAGRFFLFNKRANTANTVYTNLLIIERTEYRGEPMLNYDRPERSPLLQLGLPRDRSIFPHPEMDGWTPAFRDQSDPRFTRTVEWMRSMYMPRPTYPIRFEPPFVVFNLGGEAAARDPQAEEVPGGGDAPPPPAQPER